MKKFRCENVLFRGAPRRWIREATVALTCALMIAPAQAASGRNLADLTIEQLMNESIMSVSKKEQRLGDAAAAIAVITNDDLRRSGATTIPDALRMVPGLEVAAVNAGHKAISSRGFNDTFANKLLVLVDGRAVYTPLFSGVHWDLQKTMLEDVDQIEVIRGPGATLWGANAVNGVINVVTRSAKETQGALIYGGGGSVHEALGGVRYGGQSGGTYFRAFATAQKQAANALADGMLAQDAWRTLHGGFRVDRDARSDTRLTWQADATRTDFESGGSDSLNLNTLARWTRTWSRESSLEIQAYLDRTHENEAARARETIDTADVAVQHNFQNGRHGMVWGFGYRAMETRVNQTTPDVAVRHGLFRHGLANMFAQDEFSLLNERLTLTAGVKLEHNDFTRFEIQPNVRAVYKPAAQQTVWSAVSRAVRTPSELESDNIFSITAGAPFRGPGGAVYQPRLVSNAELKSETLWSYQAGYRVQLNARTSVDLAGFYNVYDRIAEITAPSLFVPGVPLGVAELSWDNTQHATTFGGEAMLTVALTDAWRLATSYSGLGQRQGVPNAAGPPFETGSPKHQIKFKSSYDFGRVSIDNQFRFVDRLMSTPGYTTADVRFSYRPNDTTEFSLVGQNLFESRHREHGLGPLTVYTETRRSVHVKMSLRF